MLEHFFKLGVEAAWNEATKTASWTPPVLGGLGGAALGALLLPQFSLTDRSTNPLLGALLGAGLGVGGVETTRALRELEAPVARREWISKARGLKDYSKKLRAEYPEWDWPPELA